MEFAKNTPLLDGDLREVRQGAYTIEKEFLVKHGRDFLVEVI
jgi:hypothetical protein